MGLYVLVEILAALVSHFGMGLRAKDTLSIVFDIVAFDRKRNFLSPTFVVGALFMIFGGLIRAACYREMGRMFPFHLSLRNDHKLITGGPYSLVRHPAYTGLTFALLGVTLCALSDGMWWMESGVMKTIAGKAIALLWTCMVLLSFKITGRAWKEDELLKMQFGQEWEDYAKDVKYMFVPGLICKLPDLVWDMVLSHHSIFHRVSCARRVVVCKSV